jgi:uncharacterized protein YdeI (YjbR/CyaY-like superfamily)
MSDMKQIRITTQSQWRQWLARNHNRENGGVWLVFHKKNTGKPALSYEESVEEALCFGWIDSIIKRIDEDTYCRKFTPRKIDSAWSNSNKQRVKKITKEGRMTEFGQAKVDAAKKSGRWKVDPRPVIAMDIPPELAEALGQNTYAKEFFKNLAPTYRRQFIGWVITAKRAETKAMRVKESLVRLSRGEKLGLK